MLRPLLLALMLSAATPALASRAEVTCTDRYEQALRYMNRAYYTKALEQFQKVRNFCRDDPVSVKAELAIADMHYKKGDYEQARLEFEDFTRLHPRHELVGYATYMTGLAIYKRAPRFAGRDQTSTRQAVNVWTSFDARFPSSEHTENVERYYRKCRNRLAAKELSIARFYAKRGAWQATRGRAEGLLRRYPDVDAVPEALYLAGRGYHAWGQVEEAKLAQDRLSSEFPNSRYIGRLARVLNKQPGTPEEDERFIRPYRFPGMNMGQPSM